MTKPLVFNYKQYEELRQAYKDLLEDNNKLIADNKRLRKENANLQIKLRIMEADNETAG
jgi:regulator of replication initiation timing